MNCRQVQRELEQLQALALVSVETQETPHGQAMNIYTLLVPPTSGRRALSIQVMKRTQGTRGSTPRKKENSAPESESIVDDGAHTNDQASAAPLALWTGVLAGLQDQMVPSNFTRWVARTTLLSHDAGAAVVGVPDQVIEGG
jgi:hypothetical protein